MNGQGLVRCPVCNVTHSAMSPEEYHFLRVYRRVLAKIHYAKLHGYEIMHYIFEPFEIFHYLPKVNSEMYMAPLFILSGNVMFHSKRSSEPLELYATECVDSIDEDGPTEGHVFYGKQKTYRQL